RRQVVRRTAVEPAIQHEELVEAAHRGDHPRHRAWRQAAGALLPDERLEHRAIERFRTASRTGGVLRQRAEISTVALEGVIGEPALDAEVIEVGVDHASRYDSIRGSFARVR